MATDALAELLGRWGPIADLQLAAGLLRWDQQTKMPPNGGEARAQVLATLATLHHEALTDDTLLDVLERADEAGLDEAAAGQLAWARREIEQARAIPASLASALAACESRNMELWRHAREEDDFSLFAEGLEEGVRLNRERAACLSDGGNLYDALLDLYEPGFTEAELVTVFDELQSVLVPLRQAVADTGKVVDEAPARGRFPLAAQLSVATEIVEAMGFDMGAGRVDETTHPFCATIGVGDVRLTWRASDTDFRHLLFGLMHEAGHGLYNQGLPSKWARTPLWSATGLGMHESQSRLWENQVGRSEAFWEWAMPRFHREFPAAADITPATLYPVLHTCRPSFIRVEADEATYNLHIAARFHIERALFAGEVEVADLPDLWNDTYEGLLGIRPRTAAEGVLQDVHWGMGAFGYFPTYTLGNLIAAQLFEVAEGELGDLHEAFRRGEFLPLREWLRTNVHSQGRLHQTSDLVARVCGGPITAGPFLRYLSTALERVYGDLPAVPVPQ